MDEYYSHSKMGYQRQRLFFVICAEGRNLKGEQAEISPTEVIEDWECLPIALKTKTYLIKQKKDSAEASRYCWHRNQNINWLGITLQ